jgi:NADH dehydrogenase
MRVVVIGGGYAGLATVITLRQTLPDVEIHLVDPREQHLKITHLHQTLQRPLSDFCTPFAGLAQKFDFTHHRFALPFANKDLEDWQWHKTLPLPDGDLPFDYLVIATGARPRRLPAGGPVYNQEDFWHQEGQEIVQDFLARTENRERHITVVGAGATGLQFLFELDYLLTSRRVPYQLRLIHKGEQILPSLPGGFHDTVYKRLRSAGIDYRPHTRYLSQHGEEIRLQNTRTGESYTLPSRLTLLFPGVHPHPQPLQANRYGRVVAGGHTLPHIFTAGDCSHFSSRGLNTLTAQAAVRKGRQIAANIKRIRQGRLPYLYAYAELGYFVSLGPWDGIGWMFFKSNLITGIPAFVIKETIEAQYDLFVEGVDLYF